MLTPELSQLKGAPSTCVCSDGHRNEKAIIEDVQTLFNAQRFESALACCSTKLKVKAKADITATESEK